jgi:RNA polymerase sigma factor (sigma-70 family)
MREVIRHLRRAAVLHKGDGPSDGQLLESFIARREEIAFEALLRRHGPMVLGVCQRILRNLHDAEDAFQATFLVLARKAGSVMPREMVGGWLYGVAYRTAMKARAMNAKRRTKERLAGEMPRSGSSTDEDLLAQLDHELSRLPDKYRVPVVLCELQGKSRREAARMLEIPEGTLSWRLAQARKLLAKRLTRKELVFPLAAIAVGLSPTLRASTLKTALTAGAVPAKVLALTEGVIKAMLLTKLKLTVCVATLAVVAGIGATGLTYRATAEEPKKRVYSTFFSGGAATRPATDDVEALRLEIEALRKELRATKERVKALEEQVRSPEGPNPVEGRLKEHQLRRSTAEAPLGAAEREAELRARLLGEAELRTRKERALAEYQKALGEPRLSRPTRDGDNLLSKAEAALKKLREKTNDQEEVEVLERALRRLKEREKVNEHGQVSPGAKP